MLSNTNSLRVIDVKRGAIRQSGGMGMGMGQKSKL